MLSYHHGQFDVVFCCLTFFFGPPFLTRQKSIKSEAYRLGHTSHLQGETGRPAERGLDWMIYREANMVSNTLIYPTSGAILEFCMEFSSRGKKLTIYPPTNGILKMMIF